MDTRKRNKSEILDYLKFSLRVGDRIIHRGFTSDGKQEVEFYNVEVKK